MNEIWVIRPGALGDTILALPLVEKVSQLYKNDKIIFWGNTEYAAVIHEFFPEVEFRSFLSIGLMPLFTCDFNVSDLKFKHPFQIFAILKKDKTVEKNLNMICSNIVWSEISKENNIWVVNQFLAMVKFVGEPPFSSIKKTRAGSRLLIHMGTGSSAKLLPDDFWQYFVSKLLPQFSITVLFGPAEKMSLFQSDNDIQILKNIPLKDLIAKMNDFQLYLGLDSGISHLAGVMGLKGVSFFHATDPIYWKPMGDIKPFIIQKNEQESWENALSVFLKTATTQ